MRRSRAFFVLCVGGGLWLGAACVQAQSEYEGCFIQQGDAQSAAQRPSPLGVTVVTLGGKEAKLCYGRPSARGRTMLGGNNPFGEPWRLGANEATAIHLPFAAVIGTVPVGPGSYSLYVIPGPDEWQVFVNGNAERWGIPIDDRVRAEDVGSFKVRVSPTKDMVEQLTFTWVQDGSAAGRLVFEWEHTHLEIPVSLPSH
jgi:hypothetical protein